jgi:D-cysteine desulfhydrase
MTGDPLWPLLDRFPGLADVPRVVLRAGPTPVERIDDRLWIKRDDLTADPVGGNKIRSLEFLLARHRRGDRVITGGSRGSTHVLSTLVHAGPLGIEIEAASWPQEMNEVARVVDARIERETTRHHFRSAITAALWLTWRSWKGDAVIPAGGTAPLGMLGQVNAAFELAAQIREGLLPPPARVIVPLGTGGTLAGLYAGFLLAGVETELVGARVVPSVVANDRRVQRLAKATNRLIRGRTGEVAIAAPAKVTVRIDQRAYGGAYGRPLRGAPASTATGVRLDPTYTAKAYVAAQKHAKEHDTLFWMTFDSRWMTACPR